MWINRAMCQTIIQEAGLPIPSKSRCSCCPHQNDYEWKEVADHPEDWARAVEVERQINASDPEQSGLYLHKGRVPLRMAEFGGADTESRPCEAGNCFT